MSPILPLGVSVSLSPVYPTALAQLDYEQYIYLFILEMIIEHMLCDNGGDTVANGWGRFIDSGYYSIDRLLEMGRGPRDEGERRGLKGAEGRVDGIHA